MTFLREEKKKSVSLPGMIDIIFLLLIFALVTLSVSQATIETEKRGERGSDFDLPYVRSPRTQELGEVISTLIFQVEKTDAQDAESLRKVTLLRPSGRDSLTLSEAKLLADQDSMFAFFPPDFLSLTDAEFEASEACRLIKNTLAEYKDAEFFEPSPANSVEIRAVSDTEFRIVGYILDCCSAYGDTIPNIQLHTLGSPGGGNRGI